MSSKARNNDVGEEKLEDILRSIRGIIDNHNNSSDDISNKNEHTNLSDDSVLELTTEFKEDSQDHGALLSKNNADKISATIKSFADKINSPVSNQQETKVDATITSLIKPMLKEWLDNNLSRLVEKVIAEELRKLIPKK